MDEETELRLLRNVHFGAQYAVLPCRHGYTFCLGEVIQPEDRRGGGLQFYDGEHATGSIGFMELTPRRDINVLYINLIGVESEYRRQHYSTAMISWALRAAQALRLSNIEMPDVKGLDRESQSRLERALVHQGFTHVGSDDWRRAIRRQGPLIETRDGQRR